MQNNNLKLGWLSPSGELIECGSREHVDVSYRIATQLGLPTTDTNGSKLRSDDQIMLRGWVYIGFSEFDFELRIGWNRWLTDAQKTFLKPYFEQEAVRVNQMAIFKWQQENR